MYYFYSPISNGLIIWWLVNFNHIKEVPGTNLVISLAHSAYKCANFELLDASKSMQKVYTSEQIQGGNDFARLDFKAIK